ncbi:MAG: VWA domain-containing protein [Bacteroidetes bacterium]|nr:VWA domain-containing protein [Bacteroidota bacterium]
MNKEEQELVLKRWRLLLGKEVQTEIPMELNKLESGIDKTLEALYNSDRKGGLGPSSPNVARWLGDIREYFPASTVQLLQKDALSRLNLQQMLTEPEMLESVVPDVHLVANLMTMGRLIPQKTKATARMVIKKVVDELIRKLESPTRQAITGSINRSVRNRNPRFNEINWPETIRKNLKHYQPDYKTIIPETRIGFGKKRRSLRDIVLCIDQSGSMGASVVYSGIFGAVIASIPAVDTRMVVFDTSVADLTEDLKDPVDLLFGVQLGGGTDINQALQYCQQIIRRPTDTILFLITDLYEGGDTEEMRKRFAALNNSGVQVITLLALDDNGNPSFDHSNADFLAQLGIPVFGCSPDLFPDLMAAAIAKHSISTWAGNQGIKLAGQEG